MARSLPEWIGKTPDTNVPERVRMRNFDAHGGICHVCKLPIKTGETWDTDHVIPLKENGPNRESNLAPTHRHCHVAKTNAEKIRKSKVASVRAKHIGIARKTQKIDNRPFQQSEKTARRKRKASEKLPVPEPRPLFRKVNE